MSDVGRYRKLYARLWRHPGFVGLTDGEKVLAIYVLTGPQSNRLGLYTLSVATAAEDLGTVPQTLTKRLVRVCQTFGWLFDARARVVYLPSFWKWNPPDNVNIVKGSLRDLNEIPPCGLVDAFARNLEILPETLRETFLEQLRQRLPKPSPTQDQYQESGTGTGVPALRAVAERKSKKSPNPTTSLTPDARLVTIARQTIQEARHETLDYQVDALLDKALRANLQANRQTAVVALAQAGRDVAATA